MRRVFLLLILAALLLIIVIPTGARATTGASVDAASIDAASADQSVANVEASAANADQAQGTGIYIVRRGDTLSSIAARHCMTTTELFNLNSSILSNPNQIYVGMQLRVINRCGGGGGGGGGGGSGGNWGVCDRGPSQHAQGTVSGSRYFVARGDTSFSIATRFGISVTALCQANGIDPWRIFAGQTLIIPGLSGSCGSCGTGNWNCPPNNCWNCPPTNCPGWNCPATAVPPRPTVVPITPQPTVATPFIQIDRPRSGETLQPTFTVSGRAGGLFEGNVVIQAQATDGRILAQQTTILQGSNVGSGGQGTYSVQLTVPSLTAMTPGWIVVSSPQSRVNPVFAQVFFSPSGGGGGGGTVTFPPNTCWVNVGASRPFFNAAGGTQVGTFNANGAFFARSGARGTDGQLWYQVGPMSGTSATYVWVPASSTLWTTGCAW